MKKILAFLAAAALLAAGCSKDPVPEKEEKPEEPKPQTVKVTGITINKTVLPMQQGNQFQMKATVEPSNATNRKVRWSSTNPSSVYISDNGVISASKTGSAKVTATTDDGNFVAECKVAVNINEKDFKFTVGKIDSVKFYSAHSFRGDAANSVMLYYYIPAAGDVKDKTVQFVMHGTSRNADDYCNYWRLDAADKYNLVILAPCFTKKDYPNDHYQYGNVFNSEKWMYNSQEDNTYRIIESLFDFFLERTGSNAATYNIWGHSAGGQWCHRFTQFAYAPHANYIVAANAGNYTFPDMTKEYPYGWKYSESYSWIDRSAAYSRKLILMLGTADTSVTDENLPKKDEDNAQGKNRYERGTNFFKFCEDDAVARNLTFNWKKIEVPGVAHQGRSMGKAAADALYNNSAD